MTSLPSLFYAKTPQPRHPPSLPLPKRLSREELSRRARMMIEEDELNPDDDDEEEDEGHNNMLSDLRDNTMAVSREQRDSMLESADIKRKIIDRPRTIHSSSPQSSPSKRRRNLIEHDARSRVAPSTPRSSNSSRSRSSPQRKRASTVGGGSIHSVATNTTSSDDGASFTSPRRSLNYKLPSSPLTPPSSLSSSSPTLALKFDGKIYRTLDTGLLQPAGLNYNIKAGLIGEPDELIGDKDRMERDKKRKEVELRMKKEMFRDGPMDNHDHDHIDSRLDVIPRQYGETNSARPSSNTPLDRTPQKKKKAREHDADHNGPPTPTPPRRTILDKLNEPISPTLSARSSQPPLGLPFKQSHLITSSLSCRSPDATAKSPLPSVLTDLLALHTALESTLLLHLASAGSAVASAVASSSISSNSSVSSSSSRNDSPQHQGTSTLKMENMIDYPDAKKRIESSCGKRFSEKELRKLVWVWEGCGLLEEIENDTVERTKGRSITSKRILRQDQMSDKYDEEDDDLILQKDDRSRSASLKSERCAGGLGFMVTPTRINTPQGIVTTYGIGISVSIKSNPQLPKFELTSPSHSLPDPSSSSNRKASSTSSIHNHNIPPSPSRAVRGRDGMSIVALWSQGNEQRRTEFLRRIRQWWNQYLTCRSKAIHGEEPERNTDITPDPQLILDQSVGNSVVVPEAILPSLSPLVPCVAGTPSPSPKKSQTLADVIAVAVASPEKKGCIDILIEETKGTGCNSNHVLSAEERRRAMMDRIAAKAEARKPSAYQASLSELSNGSFATLSPKKRLGPDRKSSSHISIWRAEEAERFKRNSLLSRLGNVADGVWMLFEVGKKRSILLNDVAVAVAKSSIIGASVAEIETSLQMLTRLCPEFCQVKRVDREEWLCMRYGMTLSEVKEKVKEELVRATASA